MGISRGGMHLATLLEAGINRNKYKYCFSLLGPSLVHANLFYTYFHEG